MDLTISHIRSRLYPDTTSEPHDELLDLAVPLREFNALARNGINYVDDLQLVFERGDQLPGIGPRGWQHIHDALRAFRQQRGEPQPAARAEPTAPPPAPRRLVRTHFEWTVLEEQRLLDELAAAAPGDFRFAVAMAAERRGVSAASINGKYNGIAKSSRAPAPNRWTPPWRRRLEDEIDAAGNEREAAVAAWATRRRCSVEEIEQQLESSESPRRRSRPHETTTSTGNPTPLTAQGAADPRLADLTMSQLLDLDRRVRHTLETRVAAMHTVISPELALA